MVHDKCRSENYSYKTPDGELCHVKRFPVPGDKVEWSHGWSEYQPVEFTAEFVRDAVWADPELDDKEFIPKWNTLDGNVGIKTMDKNED